MRVAIRPPWKVRRIAASGHQPGERNPWSGRLFYERLAACQRGGVRFLRSPPPVFYRILL
jgi:hypothetical protein